MARKPAKAIHFPKTKRCRDLLLMRLLKQRGAAMSEINRTATGMLMENNPAIRILQTQLYKIEGARVLALAKNDNRALIRHSIALCKKKARLGEATATAMKLVLRSGLVGKAHEKKVKSLIRDAQEMSRESAAELLAWQRRAKLRVGTGRR